MMHFEWNDKKGRGYIDGQPLQQRPALTFSYCWLLLTEQAAQYLAEDGAENQPLTGAKRAEVEAAYQAARAAIVLPVEPPQQVGKVAEEQPPQRGDDGRLHQAWQLRDLTPDEQQARAVELKYAVDDEAEQQRLRFVTPGAGQMLEYRETAREIEALAADPSPDPKNYPFLMAEKGLMGETPQEIAAAVSRDVGGWYHLGPVIKRLRRTAKASIDAALAAGDMAALEAAAQVDWSEIDQTLAQLKAKQP